MASRALLAAAIVVASGAGSANAQFRAPRSADYLFAASVVDGRALWVNPAGLAVVYEASLIGEILLSRNVSDDYSVAQFGAGFNSRGIAFGFRRDRFDNGNDGNTFRIGAARALRRVAVGASFTVYSGLSDQREVDLGLRFLLHPSLEIGAVVQHLGKPTVRGVRLMPAGTLGLAWSVRRIVQLNAEATATDRVDGSGYDMTYRAGATLALAGFTRLPAALLAAVDFGDDIGTERLVLGLVVGGAKRGVLVGHGARREGTTFVDGVSVTGVASRELGRPEGGR